MRDGYIVDFNSKFRDKCLNEQWCKTPQLARTPIDGWRQDYGESQLFHSC